MYIPSILSRDLAPEARDDTRKPSLELSSQSTKRGHTVLLLFIAAFCVVSLKRQLVSQRSDETARSIFHIYSSMICRRILRHNEFDILNGCSLRNLPMEPCRHARSRCTCQIDVKVANSSVEILRIVRRISKCTISTHILVDPILSHVRIGVRIYTDCQVNVAPFTILNSPMTAFP